MVYKNGFGVKVITISEQDKLNRDGANYVAIRNNTEYKLQLTNDRSTDAMAEVFIEDESVGTWFIPSNKSITIDRPASIARKFTFFRETDSRAINAGVEVGDSANGLVRVVFYPKKEQSYVIIPFNNRSPRFSQLSPNELPIRSLSQESSMKSMAASPRSFNSMNSYQSGATVLGNESYQQFDRRRRFSDDEIDWSNKTEIIIRLIVKPSFTNSNKPYISIRDSVIPSAIIPPRVD